MPDNDKIKFLKRQIKLENRIIATAEESVKEVNNSLVKEIILAISLDSKKHASMLGALLSIQQSTAPFISEQVSLQLKENIKQHIELEQQAIETYKELLETLTDEQEKLIVQTVYNDEIRHHALLKKVYDIIIEKETLDEGEIWEFIKDDFIPQY